MKDAAQIFEKMGADAYDKGNTKLVSISANLHFLMTLILKELQTNANALCVGVGTGADIIELAKHYPNWNFVGLDPSTAMLDGCKKKLAAYQLSERCELFHGYLSSYQTDKKFDVVICLFVMHFVDEEERRSMYQDMADYLNPGGYLVEAEISTDLEDDSFPEQLKNWQSLHQVGGTAEENLANMENDLKETLSVLSPRKVEAIIAENGFSKPIQFFQSLLIRAWYARKLT